MTQFVGDSYSPPSGFTSGSAAQGQSHIVQGPDGRMWACGTATAGAYLLAFTTGFTMTSYAVGSSNSGVDCCTDGTYVYAVTYVPGSTCTVYKVTTGGTVTTLASFSLAVGGGYYAGPSSCLFDGTYIWIYGDSAKPAARLWSVTTGGTVTAYTLSGTTTAGTGASLTLWDGAFWLGRGSGYSSATGLFTANYPSPSTMTNYASSPLNHDWGQVAYDGTSLWVGDGNTVTPSGVVKVNPTTGGGTATGTPSGNSYPMVYDGSLVWGASVSNGAFSFSPGSPGTYTTYSTYYVGGSATAWYGGEVIGLDSSNNVWVLCSTGSPARYEIATNLAPAYTTQLVMLV